MEAVEHELIPVELEDIPAFTSEAEEHQFWSTHSFGPKMLAAATSVPLEGDEWAPPARPRTLAVPIRFGADVIARTKALAVKRNTGYQTLIKEFVLERLYEEEKRAGLR